MPSSQPAFIDQKLQYRKTLEICLSVGIAAHLLAFLTAPPLSISPFELARGNDFEVVPMEHRPEIEIQPIPEEIDRSQLGDILAEIEATSEPIPYLELPETPSPFSENPRPGIPAGPVPFSAVEVLPQVLSSVIPEYPEIARDARAEGMVRVLVTVSPTGHVREAVVIDSDTVSILREAARKAALGYLFSPGKQQGNAVEAQVVLTFTFELR